ncbi:MAG: FAD-binding oxidoreductase [Paracoccaceae bacterium]
MSRLNPASGSFLEKLSGLLPPDTLTPPEPHHITEPRGLFPGHAGAVARPRTTEDVARIVHACHAGRVPVIPFGGGTGLVGGQVTGEAPAPLVLSMERMNRVRGLWPEENVAQAEAGVILADLRAAAAAAGRLFPLSLASEGTCRIGGNLATNAGGINVLRYGNARALCLGLEAVLPDGRIWNGLSRLRKDNTGYDLKDLLIGSEGTLGVITAASLALVPQPGATATALIAVRDPAAALSLLSLARDRAGEGVSAFELLHRTGFEFLAETLPDIRQPWPAIPDWSVLIELGLNAGTDPVGQIAALFHDAAEAGWAQDGIIAQNARQQKDLWGLREAIPEANRRIGPVASHDISLPLSVIPDFLTAMATELAALGPLRINGFGHLGDGNLHYNVFPPKGKNRDDMAHLRAQVSDAVYARTVAMGGSISAEHGIGRAKAALLERFADPARLGAMRAIKAALDPRGIMNPGAVLRR